MLAWMPENENPVGEIGPDALITTASGVTIVKESLTIQRGERLTGVRVLKVWMFSKITVTNSSPTGWLSDSLLLRLAPILQSVLLYAVFGMILDLHTK